MNDQELENLLRDLKPAPLPDDLQRRLSDEPGHAQGVRGRGTILVLVSGIAAAIAVFVGMIALLESKQNTAADEMVTAPDESAPSKSGQSDGANEVATATDRPVSVVKKDSTLLNSRLLAIEEHEGEFWEISEEEWRDDTLVLYSAGPSKLNSSVIRHEVVCAPLTFQ